MKMVIESIIDLYDMDKRDMLKTPKAGDEVFSIRWDLSHPDGGLCVKVQDGTIDATVLCLDDDGIPL